MEDYILTSDDFEKIKEEVQSRIDQETILINLFDNIDIEIEQDVTEEEKLSIIHVTMFCSGFYFDFEEQEELIEAIKQIQRYEPVEKADSQLKQFEENLKRMQEDLKQTNKELENIKSTCKNIQF